MPEEPTQCCQPPGSGRGGACLSFLAVILVHLPGAVGMGVRQGADLIPSSRSQL